MTKKQIENTLQLFKDKKLVYVFKSAPYAGGNIFEHYISKETDIFDFEYYRSKGIDISRYTYDYHKGKHIINNSDTFLPKNQFMFLKDNKRHKAILLRFIKNHFEKKVLERKQVEDLLTNLPYV